MPEPVRFPASCGDMVDAYPPSYDATCPVHGHVRVLTAVTDPDDFRAEPVPPVVPDPHAAERAYALLADTQLPPVLGDATTPTEDEDER